LGFYLICNWGSSKYIFFRTTTSVLSNTNMRGYCF